MRKIVFGVVAAIALISMSGCAGIQTAPHKEEMKLVNRGVYDYYRVTKVKAMSIRSDDLVTVVKNGYVVSKGIFSIKEEKKEEKSEDWISELGKKLTEVDKTKILRRRDEIVNGYEITVVNKNRSRTYIYALQPIKVGSVIKVYKSEAYSRIEAVIIK